jgi:hypothetical protein
VQLQVGAPTTKVEVRGTAQGSCLTATPRVSDRTWFPASPFIRLTRRSTTGSIQRPSQCRPISPGGNLGRNVGRGPGYYEIDTALEKKTSLTERLALDFRVEAFSLLNHPIYGDPGSNVSSGDFGVVTSRLDDGATGTGSSRRLQFMLRLEF